MATRSRVVRIPSEYPECIWRSALAWGEPGESEDTVTTFHPEQLRAERLKVSKKQRRFVRVLAGTQPLDERAWLAAQTSQAVLASWLSAALTYLSLEVDVAAPGEGAPEAERRRVCEALASFRPEPEADEELGEALAALPETDAFHPSFVAAAAMARASLGSDLVALGQCALALWSVLPGDLAERVCDAAKAEVIREALEV